MLPVSSSPSSSASPLDDGSKKTMMANFEDWMKVWVATISHQDPMNPMDAGEMATQFATFGQAIGMIEVKDELKKANAMQANGQLLEAASQIDRFMEFNESKIYFGPDEVSDVKFTPPAGAAKCKVTILDDRARVVGETSVTAVEKERNTFKWDGKMSDGTVAPRGQYHVRITPLGADNKPYVNARNQKDFDLNITVTGRVSGGTRIKGAPMFLVGGEGGATYPIESMMAIKSSQTPAQKLSGAPLEELKKFIASQEKTDLAPQKPVIEF